MELRPASERLACRMGQACAVLAGGAALAIGVGRLFGDWSSGVFGPGCMSMAPSTAWLMVLLNSSVFMLARWPDRRLTKVFAGVTAAVMIAVGMLAGASPLFGVDMPFEAWSTRATITAAEMSVGRMPLAGAVSALLAGITVGVLAFSATRRSFPRFVAAGLASAVVLIGVVGAYSCLLNSSLLDRSGFRPIVFLKVTTFILSGAGLLVVAAWDNWFLQLLAGESAGGEARSSRRFEWAILAGFVLFAGVTGTIGFRHFRLQLVDAKAKTWDYLSAIANLKTAEIVDRQQRRFRDGAYLATSHFGPRRLERFLNNSMSEEAQRALRRGLETMRRARRYETIAVFDSQGILRMSVPSGAAPPDATAREDAATALRNQRITMSDLRPGDGPSDIHVNVAVPLLASGDLPADGPSTSTAPGSTPLAVVLLRVNANQFLFPLIQSWPTPSPTAETLLVRPEGDGVLVLNELRYRKDTALRLRLPANLLNLRAAKDGHGEGGIVEGVDYRGVPVLAAVRPVPDTPWIMIAKVDQEEIYAPTLEQARNLSIAFAAVTAIVAWGLGWAWRRRREEFLSRQLAVERERTALAERLAHLMKSANDIIFLADESWQIVEANDRAVATYGYSSAEVRRMKLMDFCAPQDRAPFAQAYERLEATGHGVFEVLHRRKDGSTFPVESSVRLVEIGGVTYGLAIIRDITDRKRADEALRRASAYNRSLIEASLDPLVTIDGDGKITDVNAATEKVTGRTRQELIGTDFFDYFTEPEKARAGYQRVFRQGSVQDYALEMLHRDGHHAPVLYNASVYRDEGGKIIGIFAAARDITARKRAEEERERLNAQLREAQKLEAVGRFGRGVAHDFNNLMATVLGLASHMKSKRRPDDPDHVKLTQIEEAAETAAKLAHQLLDFAKGGKVRPSLLSFADVVKSALALVPPTVPPNVTLNRQINSDSWQVNCDQTQLQQVIVNLCRNALEAMPNGGRLTIMAENCTLASPLNEAKPPLAAGEYVCLSVEDTGCGMDAKTMELIFDPFFTTKACGHGLGLAAAYGVVAAHGGAISVTSEPGKGSTFRMWLPRAESGKRSS